VRLRAYADGKVRDYRGERYQPLPAGGPPLATAPGPGAGDGTPRLLDPSGKDITPNVEPEPLVAIDRLAVVPVKAGRVASVSLTLQGACFGTMADIHDFTALQTCVDTQWALVPATPETTSSALTGPGASQQGAFEAPYAVPCTGSPRPGTIAKGVARVPDGTPLHDDDICVTGGAFVFGSADDLIQDMTDDAPERVALVPSFYMDKYEVTEARFQAAIAKGLAVQAVEANDGSLMPPEGAYTMCTGSDSSIGRDEYPLNCAAYTAARAVCRFSGGDLPLEVQWEYAAAMSGRPAKTHYAWGDGSDQPPLCRDAIYDRGDSQSSCTGAGYGPTAVTAADHEGGDRSVQLGIVDLAGNVAELMRDTFASKSANCWASAPLELPSCVPGAGPLYTTRGGAWDEGPDQLLAVAREFLPGGLKVTTAAGFRCMRPGAP
jgi:formylglycine-generating enzyme required for sulfatase activity